ncbi:MAG: hypothetical protein ACI4DK_09805 [Lachnospiraceae bacterium]
MNNLILFVNSILSYLLVFAIVVVLCAIAIAIGITMRKKKDAKLALQSEAAKEQNDIAES